MFKKKIRGAGHKSPQGKVAPFLYELQQNDMIVQISFYSGHRYMIEWKFGMDILKVTGKDLLSFEKKILKIVDTMYLFSVNIYFN